MSSSGAGSPKEVAVGAYLKHRLQNFTSSPHSNIIAVGVVVVVSECEGIAFH